MLRFSRIPLHLWRSALMTLTAEFFPWSGLAAGSLAASPRLRMPCHHGRTRRAAPGKSPTARVLARLKRGGQAAGAPGAMSQVVTPTGAFTSLVSGHMLGADGGPAMQRGGIHGRSVG